MERREYPLEKHEQAIVVNYLRGCGAVFFAVPNGAYLQGQKGRRSIQWKALEKQGVSKGVPDLVVAPKRPGGSWVFLEMKRDKRARPVVSDDQRDWHERLSKRGAVVLVGYGAMSAIEQLRELGYGRSN